MSSAWILYGSPIGRDSMYAPQFWIQNQPSLSPHWRIEKVVNMIRKKGGIQSVLREEPLSVFQSLCTVRKVSVWRVWREIPIRVERFIATHPMRCFLKRRYACLLHSLNIMHCIALYPSSFFLIHARYCMYGSFKEVSFKIIYLVYQSHFIQLVYQSHFISLVYQSHFIHP